MKSKIEGLGKVSITVEKDYWDKNKAYNRLTIVERQGTRTAYLSRKVVPIGVDITDRNYWITISKWADIPYEIVQEFGDSTEVVISQKVVTLKVNELQGLIDDINEIIGEGGSIDERIDIAKLELVDGASEEGNTLKKLEDRLSDLEESVGEGGSVDERIAAGVSIETNRAQAAEELLREAYESLSQSQSIPKTAEEWAAMTSWEEGVIYRVAGTTSYTDYMYNGTTTIPMATYNNAIDDEPTAGSDNLVKSGGVFDSLNNYKEIIPDNVRTNVINSLNIWAAKSNNHYGYIIPIMSGKSYKYVNGSAENYIGILKSDNNSSVGDTPDYSTSYPTRITVESDGIFSFIAPDDAHYIYIRKNYQATMNFSFFQGVNLKEELDKLEDAVEHVKFKNDVLVNDVEIIKDFCCAGQDNSIVSSHGIADLSKLTYSNEVALSTQWNKRFYIDTNGLYAATDSNNLVMGVNPVLQGDCIEITTGVSDITILVGFLNSIDNMAAGNQPDIMQGTSTKSIPKETTARFYAPSNGYFFFMSINYIYPTLLKRFIPLRKSILMENLSVKKIIASGCMFNSDTDATSNVINTVNVSIPANTEFYIQTTGIGTYSSSWGLSINRGNAVYYSDSLKKLSSSVDVTTIRIITRRADFITSGEVSAEVYIEDLGTIIPTMQSDIKDIKEAIDISPLYAINVDTLKNAAGVSTNEFTESFSFDITTNELKNSNVIFNCVSKYIQAEDVTDVPTIQIYDSNLASNYRQRYIVGGKDTFECKQWRYPMLIGSNNTITVVFTIPSGVTLTVNSFSVTQSNEIARETMKLYEHNGYWGGTFNARFAFQQAAICGYYGAIVVPKMTVDGVLVCYHDDGTLSTNNDLQMVGGEPLTQELGALKMNELTFAQTQMLEYKSANILGEHSRIPTIEEFFECCAKTGVHPCLSCHPALDTDKFGAVKALADKYHITDKLTIKQNSAYATTVFNVFGNSIEAYLPDIPATTDDLTSTISNLDAANFDKTKVVVGVEFMNTTKALEALNRAVGGVSDLVSAGYVWGVFNNTPDINIMNQLNDAGCYEWTIGAFFCNGLNW